VTLYAQKDVREELVNGHDETPRQYRYWDWSMA
jgi:hypothetical protein